MKRIMIALTCVFGFLYYSSFSNVNVGSVSSGRIKHKSSNCKIVSYNGGVYVITIYRDKMNFRVTDGEYTDNHFYVNANFFGHRGEPLGECVVNGRRVSGRNRGGGFFTSDGGNGDVSIYGRNKSRYVSQTGYVAIRNGRVNNSYNRSRWGRLITDRVMIGENKDGDIVIVHTSSGGRTTIPMMNRIALESGVYNAIHLDGGPSVEVGVRDGYYVHEFIAFPRILKKLSGTPMPPVHIVGNFRD